MSLWGVFSTIHARIINTSLRTARQILPGQRFSIQDLLKSRAVSPDQIRDEAIAFLEGDFDNVVADHLRNPRDVIACGIQLVYVANHADLTNNRTYFWGNRR